MKVAIYVRLSEEDRDKANPQADSESIQNQKNMLVRETLRNGWEIYDIYNDDDYRGSDRERPEFNRLLRDAEARKFDIVMCKSQSRLTRELELVEKLIHGRFVELGIRFIGLVDNADTNVKGNKKSRQINGLVNEWYLEDLSESVSAAKETIRQRGEHTGSFALYGYLRSKEQKGKLIIDEVAAATVRRIFRLHSEGYGFVAIAKVLNDEGIPNPTTYKAQLGMRTMTKKRAGMSSVWYIQTVRSILQNRMYAGDMVQGCHASISYKSKRMRSVPKEQWTVVKGTHEPIIDTREFEATQERLKLRTKERKTGTVHLFAGKVYCMECGAALHTNNSKGFKYLRCPKGEVAKAHCGGSCVPVSAISQRVLEGVNSLLHAYYSGPELDRRVVLSDTVDAELKAHAKEKAAREKALADMKKAALSLYLDKAKGVLTEKNFVMLSEELSVQKDGLEKRLRSLDDQMTVLNQKLQARKSRAEIIAKYKNFTELNRELVNDFIERIEVGKQSIGDRTRQLKIIWRV